MATSFEKVMNACLEAKKTPASSQKKVVETKKAVSKKVPASKRVTESNRARKARRFYEEDDREDVEFDTVNDIPSVPDVDEIDVDFDVINDTPVADDDYMDDVVDDVVVVVDPEVDAEEIDSVATELQDIIDDTPDGETPTTDEYVGNYTYGCPVCGTTFFSETEMNDGDECPVCNNTPNGFVLVGQVVSTEDAPVDDDETYDDVDVDLDVEEPVDDGEEIVDNGEEIEIADDEEEEQGATAESLRRARAMRARKEALRRNAVRKPATRRTAPKSRYESRTRRPATRSARPATRRYESARKTMNRPASRTANRGLMLDESTFNPVLTRFIRENYKNARSFTVKSAKLDRAKKSLRLECVITMKSGSKKKSAIRLEGFVPTAKVVKGYDASRTFKCESRNRTAPFTFKINKVGNVIKCEGLRYNYTTKLKEGKRYQVTGNVLKESRTPAKRPVSRSARPMNKRYK